MKNKSLKFAFSVIMAGLIYMGGYMVYDLSYGKTATMCKATVAMIKGAYKNGVITAEDKCAMVYYVNSGIHTLCPAYARREARRVRAMVEHAYEQKRERQDCQQYEKVHVIKCHYTTKKMED